MSWKAERLLEDNNSVPKSSLITIFISNSLNIWYCRNTDTGFNKLRRRWEKMYNNEHACVISHITV